MQELDSVRQVVRNGKWDRFIAIIVFVAVIGMAHGDNLIDGFVGLKRAEIRLIKNHKKRM